MSDSSEILRRKLVASHKALWDCGVCAPVITVLNKVDGLGKGEMLEKKEKIEDLAPNPVLVSASCGQGLMELSRRIRQRLLPLKEYQIRLPYTSQSLSQLSRLYETSELLQVSYEEEMVVRLRGRKETVARLKSADRH